jgi:hypothetical protein
MATTDRTLNRTTHRAEAIVRVRAMGPEIVLAMVAFTGMAIAVLLRAPQLLEPDDYAYRASIAALSHFHILLSNAQYVALEHSLGAATSQATAGAGGGAIQQWHQAVNGLWISEKNPGYPFLAVPFQWLGVSRVTPLFYGALGCIGLWFGGRRWLGRWGGAFAVVMFCTSGAALAFAWRATMETFTDASLVAAGTGALVWCLLARESSQSRRRLVGVAGLLALALATWARYTDAIALIVAIAAIGIVARRAGIAWRTLQIWASTVVLAAAGILAFNQYAYGGWNRTGYSGGQITFSFGALSPNLRNMPSHLVEAMPMLVLGLVAAGWIGVRAVTVRGAAAGERAARSRDVAVAAALGAAWAGVWVLYACYDWTARMGAQSGNAIHVIRFYVPALGLIALLGAWPLARLVRAGSVRGGIAAAAILISLVLAGGWSYQHLVSGGQGPGGGAPGRHFPSGGGTPPTGSTSPSGAASPQVPPETSGSSAPQTGAPSAPSG